MTAGRSILVGGKPFPCAVPVHSMADTGHSFTARVRQETRWVVNHWTASENSAEAVYRNLVASKRSVHFVIDQLGEVWQYADTAARLAHAVENGGNTYGVGIEIVNAGSGPVMRGYNRHKRTELVHGRKVVYGDFYESQVGAAILLNHAICEAYGLPVQCPIAADGDVWTTVLPVQVMAQFRGVLGHYCLDFGKVDPAPELLRRIHASGLPPRVA